MMKQVWALFMCTVAACSLNLLWLSWRSTGWLVGKKFMGYTSNPLRIALEREHVFRCFYSSCRLRPNLKVLTTHCRNVLGAPCATVIVACTAQMLPRLIRCCSCQSINPQDSMLYITSASKQVQVSDWDQSHIRWTIWHQDWHFAPSHLGQ